MNIRKNVKFGFTIIVGLILLLGFISAIITFGMKQNNYLLRDVASILSMQENMNDILSETIATNELKKLEKLKSDFSNYELQFEALKHELTEEKIFNPLHFYIRHIQTDKVVIKYLDELYNNERLIETVYDATFSLEKQVFDSTTIFNELYPQEKNLRIEIETIILSGNSVEELKELSNLRYYSKETLYQHSDQERLAKWIAPIKNLIILAKQKNKKSLHEKLEAYLVVVQNIGEKAIELANFTNIENQNIIKVSKILETNKKLNQAIEQSISELSNSFTTSMQFFQFIIGLVAIFFIVKLSVKVSRNVSLTMDEVEAKIEEGLKEVNALNKEIEDTQKEVLFTMGSIGESRSKETGNHVKRVAEYCKILALHYGMDENEAEMLKLASPMHDIGKVAIPDAVLNKPGRFDEEERKIMDTHAMMGYEMLKHSNRPLLKIAAIVAREHHEKYDGTGYPDKKSGENIHIYGRITALADVFDALGSARVYKPAWNDEKIFALFKEERGKHFDPKLIDIFFENLDEFLAIRDSMRDV